MRPITRHFDHQDEVTYLFIQWQPFQLFNCKNSHLISFDHNTILYSQSNIALIVFSTNSLYPNTNVIHVSYTSHIQIYSYKLSNLTVNVLSIIFSTIEEGHVLLMIYPNMQKVSYIGVSRSIIYWQHHPCKNQGKQNGTRREKTLY